MTALASFEDFLYIIIGILWIAYSFYNAKKKKEAKKGPAPVNKKKSILETLLDEIAPNDGQDDSALYKPDPEINQDEIDSNPIQTEKPVEIFSYDDYYQESNSQPTNDVFEKESLKPTTNKGADYTIVKNSTRAKKGKKGIDLRKAVIYSEILKRVYF